MHSLVIATLFVLTATSTPTESRVDDVFARMQRLASEAEPDPCQTPTPTRKRSRLVLAALDNAGRARRAMRPSTRLSTAGSATEHHHGYSGDPP